MRDAVAAELALATFWTTYAAARNGPARYVLRHPLRAMNALRDLRALPVLEAAPSDSVGGRAMATTLGSRGFLGTPLAWNGPAVLDIPEDPAEYRLGRRRQSLRRKLVAAQRLGLRARPVLERSERTALLRRADLAEQSHPDATYRTDRPDNSDLLHHDLWLVVEDVDHQPLLLCVVPTDDEWACLRYFRTLGSGPAHSVSRYLGTAALVDALSARGVRWLVDTEHPGAQTNGLRHFQRMLGFRYARVRLRASARKVTAS